MKLTELNICELESYYNLCVSKATELYRLMSINDSSEKVKGQYYAMAELKEALEHEIMSRMLTLKK